MTNLIQTICEPRRLILAWQAPDHLGERHRWAVGEVFPSEGGYALRYFAPGMEFERFNPGRTYEALQGLGYRGYPAFDPRRQLHVQGVLMAFMRRVPPQTRSDFAEYRNSFHLSPNVILSDFSLLAVTEAKLPSDGFSLVDTLDPDVFRCDLYLEVAGFRYHGAKLSFLSQALEERIQLLPEPKNAFDPNAIQVLVRGHLIGYINRLQTLTFLRWISDNRVTGYLERLNGSADRPRAFIFVKISPKESSKAA